jgi:hypothetical protein
LRGLSAQPFLSRISHYRTCGSTAAVRGRAQNLGEDKDSTKRQRLAVAGFARRAGYDLVDEFSDPGVSGADR